MYKMLNGLVFLCTCIILTNASAQTIAISFDDAPRSETKYFTGGERTRRLISGLKHAGVKQAIFFSNTRGFNNEQRRDRLLEYAKAGHLIANHTHSHKRPDVLGVNKYLADIKEADKQLSRIPNFIRFFRYPFLDYGKSVSTRDKVEKGLKDLGYKNGYVTVDNGDWYMDYLLQNAVKMKKKIHLDRLKNAYIAMLWDSIKFYDQLATKVIGRSPHHVLLLHDNDLAALFIYDLINFIKSKGWKIITPLKAYRDPLAQIIPKTLRNNNGRIAAIAEAKGYAGVKIDFYQDNKEIKKCFQEKKVFE